jgi:hypothetical protein
MGLFYLSYILWKIYVVLRCYGYVNDKGIHKEPLYHLADASARARARVHTHTPTYQPTHTDTHTHTHFLHNQFNYTLPSLPRYFK